MTVAVSGGVRPSRANAFSSVARSWWTLRSLVSTHEVGLAGDAGEQAALGGDAVDQRAVALQRVLAAVRLVAAHQHLVAGVHVDHPGPVAGLGEHPDGLLEVAGEGPAADVDDGGEPAEVTAGAQLDHGQQQRRRQVVDDVPAEVLQHAAGAVLAGPRRAR